MAKRNNVRRRKLKKERLQEKNKPPIAMIAIGLGIILIGFAALLLAPKNDATSAGSSSPEDEYSSIPVPVDYEAPELTLENLAGEEESLADYEGTVVLVNTWATWCPPCKAELPVLEAYYEAHKDEGFVIIGINSQEPRKDVQNFIDTTDIATITYPIWIDPQGAASVAFNSFSLPASFVIDREGTVKLAWTGAISRNVLEEHVTPVIEE